MRRSAPASHNRRLSGGFPHSDIPGSKGALASPGLIAECHVLHRLLLPRHPPNALIALDPIQKTTGPFACGWFNHNPSIMSLVGSLDPSASPRQETRRSRALNDLAIRQDPRSVSFDLERLSSVSLNVLRRPPRSRPRGIRPNTRTRRSPTRERPKNVSCIALFTMSVCRMSPSGGQYLVVSLARSDRKAHPR